MRLFSGMALAEVEAVPSVEIAAAARAGGGLSSNVGYGPGQDHFFQRCPQLSGTSLLDNYRRGHVQATFSRDAPNCPEQAFWTISGGAMIKQFWSTQLFQINAMQLSMRIPVRWATQPFPLIRSAFRRGHVPYAAARPGTTLICAVLADQAFASHQVGRS